VPAAAGTDTFSPGKIKWSSSCPADIAATAKAFKLTNVRAHQFKCARLLTSARSKDHPRAHPYLAHREGKAMGNIVVQPRCLEAVCELRPERVCKKLAAMQAAYNFVDLTRAV